MIQSKDKAMELMLRYYELIPKVSIAKKCALIVVDEIINCDDIDVYGIKYYKEVKQYIIEI